VLSSSVAQRLLQERKDLSLITYPGNVESFRDLKANRIDAVLLDLPIALYYAKPDPSLRLSGGPFASGYSGIGIRKEDATLRVAIDQAITHLSECRTLECIYRK